MCYFVLLHSLPRYADSSWPRSKLPWLVRVEFGEKEPPSREKDRIVEGASDAMIERAPKKNDHPSTGDVEKLPSGSRRERETHYVDIHPCAGEGRSGPK